MVYLPPTAGVCGIFGSLGGGKSLSAVDIAVNGFINRFNFVVSNIQLKNLSERQQSYYQFIPDISKVEWFKLPCGSPRGSGGNKSVAVILDELPELLDQYSSGKEIWIKTFLSWLRHTSKRGQYVFVITQDPSFILKPVRLLCAYWIKCEDMAQYRIPIIKVKLPFCSDLISRRMYNKNGNCIDGSLNIAHKSVIGRFYDTSQGLSLYNPSSNIPNEYKNTYEKALKIQNDYRRLTLFYMFYFILFIASFLYLYLS